MDAEVLKLDESSPERKRPFPVTLLTVLVLSITIIHLVRLINAVTWWSFLSTLPGKPPEYLAITGLIGFISGSILLWGLWTGKSFIPLLTRLMTIIYLGLQWFEKVQSIRAGNTFENWPFAALATSFGLLFVIWVFSQPATKVYFGDMHE